MRTHAVLAALVLAASVAAGPARAGEPVDGPSGFLCAVSTVGDQAEIDGGPLLLVDDDGTVRSGTLTCRLRAGTVEYAPSATGTGVVTLPPVVVPRPDASTATLCTEFRYLGGPTLYYHASDDPAQDGHWTTDPTTPCALLTSTDPGDPGEPFWWLVRELLFEQCQLLALLFPPHGDVPGMVDCPPYET